MRTRPSLLLVFAVCLARSAQAQTVCDRIKALVTDPAVASAHWGVSVTTLDGTSLCAVNDAQMFRPASNNKIFTSAAALALLGPARRFTTSVVAEGQLAHGTLSGDLQLIGGGDANFGAHDIPYVAPALRPKNPAAEPATIADIEELAAKVAATGLKRVQGDIVGEDFYFAYEPYPPDWTIDDALWGYGAPVSGLTIHDNQVEIDVYPKNDRSRASAPPGIVRMIPEVPYYALENNVLTRSFGGGCEARLGFDRAIGSKLLSIYGDVPPNPVTGAQPCRQNVAIEDPPEYAALALKLALERRGVKISGVARAHHQRMQRLGAVVRDEPDVAFMIRGLIAHPGTMADCQAQRITDGTPDRPTAVLATHQGPPLADDLVYTLKVSQNLHAEIMMRNLGAAASCEHTPSSGLAAVREYLTYAGVAKADYELFDGSGLSAHDLVAPRAFTTFLQFAATQPWFAQWKAALPEGGVDGTLGARFAKETGARVFAKTGTLSQTRALSGYVETASGKTWVFSVMVDTHLPMQGADRTTMDKVVEAIAGID